MARSDRHNVLGTMLECCYARRERGTRPQKRFLAMKRATKL